MQKNILNIFLSILVLGAMMTSCKKDDPISDGRVGFRMQAVDTGSGSLKSTGGSTANLEILPLTWDTAWVVVNKLEFEAEFDDTVGIDGEEGSYEVKLEWKGNKTIDLLTEPEVFAYIELPDGVYEEIELKVKSEENEISGDPNFYLSGLYASTLGDVRITLIVNRDFEIKAEVEDWVIESGNGGFYEGLLEVSLQQLFSGISIMDLESAEIINGRIIISATSNTSLYAQILENLNTNMECDHDGDYDDDGDEDDDDDDDK